MFSRFYRKCSLPLLIVIAVTFPWLLLTATSIPINNDLEAWLPGSSPVRTSYDAFREKFGAEEAVFVGLETRDAERAEYEKLADALASRIERLPGFRESWSPGRIRRTMQELDVSDEVIEDRLNGFLQTSDGTLTAVVAIYSDQGRQNRAAALEELRAVVDYSQLRGDDVHYAGASVVVDALDRLGNPKQTRRFFMLSLLICGALLYAHIRHIKLTLGVLGVTVWAVNMNLAMVKWAGGEMNFILGSLSVMVMVFTLAVVIHFVHYYQAALSRESAARSENAPPPDADAVGVALQYAWKPCLLATLTTTIGLLSLAVSDIIPVRQFGFAASAGCVTAFLVGVGLTPALLTLWPLKRHEPETASRQWFPRVAHGMLARSGWVAAIAGVFVVVTGAGLPSITTKIQPLDFLPTNSKVLADNERIEGDLISTVTVEGVVDFGPEERPFAEKLYAIADLQKKIESHPSVQHTMSAATFFPDQLSGAVLRKAQAKAGENGFVADDQRSWRISIRIDPGNVDTRSVVFDELNELLADDPISLTGFAPLLDSAQQKIFDGFWKSFAMAFAIISAVMVISLRCFRTGALAMIPNFTPICIVFGLLGWLGIPVDIGMMMTGSIALGIAVDGTFHFLVRYNERQRHGLNSADAAESALIQTGGAIVQAAVIAALGMCALLLSDFRPMTRFGMMMSVLLVAALVGDVVLLPAVLTIRRRKRQATSPAVDTAIPAKDHRAPSV